MIKAQEVALLLGDQLNINHSWFKTINPERVYLIMELRQETDYVKHHIQKVAAFFIAMRRFAQNIENKGHKVLYLKHNDSINTGDLCQNLMRIIQDSEPQKILWQEPDEYRLDKQLRDFFKSFGIDNECFSTEHFYTERNDLALMFKGKKQFLMESFYRNLRKKYGILMNGDEPLTGQWNYDADNRLKYDGKLPIPKCPTYFYPEWQSVQEEIKDAGIQTIGFQSEQSSWLTLTREDALSWLEYFARNILQGFGPYEDAMVKEEAFLFHSRLSFALNTKLISPKEVIEVAIKAREANPEKIGYASLEGFVRQILGWREYVRGIYWNFMPDYSRKNYFNHQLKLPQYYWTGKTQMACLKSCTTQSLENAYAHHIQRLMVLGNFALLSGINPDEVDAWYLGVYADAIEWVELPNTRGMSQFADGGIVGTKPYISSANYIKKMSNYCKNCSYQSDSRVGDNACPFNTLYWDFYMRNENLLAKNPRIGMAYRQLEKMPVDEKKAIRLRAEWLKEHLDEL